MLRLPHDELFDLPNGPRYRVPVSRLMEDGAVHEWEPSRSPQPQVIGSDEDEWQRNRLQHASGLAQVLLQKFSPR
ncbi:MAG TPA: hypothetical protein VNH11_13775 [Pirellulales bacterium]|nr:hypothetical protein [Pirellulales bacterium]